MSDIVFCLDIDDCIIPSNATYFGRSDGDTILLEVNLKRLVLALEKYDATVFITSSRHDHFVLGEHGISVNPEKSQLHLVFKKEKDITDMLIKYIGKYTSGLSCGDRRADIQSLLDMGKKVITLDDEDISDIKHPNHLYCATYGFLSNYHSYLIENFINNIKPEPYELNSISKREVPTGKIKCELKDIHHGQLIGVYRRDLVDESRFLSVGRYAGYSLECPMDDYLMSGLIESEVDSENSLKFIRGAIRWLWAEIRDKSINLKASFDTKKLISHYMNGTDSVYGLLYSIEEKENELGFTIRISPLGIGKDIPTASVIFSLRDEPSFSSILADEKGEVKGVDLLGIVSVIWRLYTVIDFITQTGDRHHGVEYTDLYQKIVPLMNRYNYTTETFEI